MTKTFQQSQLDYNKYQEDIEKLKVETTQLTLASTDKLSQIEEKYFRTNKDMRPESKN
jgi:hypothetical protein